MIPILTILPDGVEIRFQPQTNFDRVFLKTLIGIGVLKDEPAVSGNVNVLRIPVQLESMPEEEKKPNERKG